MLTSRKSFNSGKDLLLGVILVFSFLLISGLALAQVCSEPGTNDPDCADCEADPGPPSECDMCEVYDVDVTLRSPDGTTDQYTEFSFDSESGTCGVTPEVTETWTNTIGYVFCPEEGSYDAQVEVIAQGEPNEQETSGWFTDVYSVNYDNDQDWCECKVGSGHWDLGGDYANPKCCEDDSNEYKINASTGSGMGSVTGTACCDASGDCVDGNSCYSDGTSTHDADGDGDDDYCDSGTWYDDQNAACDETTCDTGWSDDACGGGGCSNCKMHQTRSCDDPDCSESQCVIDSACDGNSCGPGPDWYCDGGSCEETDEDDVQMIYPSTIDAKPGEWVTIVITADNTAPADIQINVTAHDFDLLGWDYEFDCAGASDCSEECSKKCMTLYLGPNANKDFDLRVKVPSGAYGKYEGNLRWEKIGP